MTPLAVNPSASRPSRNAVAAVVAIVVIVVGGYMLWQVFGRSATTLPGAFDSVIEHKPSTSTFALSQYTWQWDGDSVNLLGTVTNNGSEPAAPIIEATAWDAAGLVVGTTRFWPASVSNVAPGDFCGIHYPLDCRAQPVKVLVKVVDTVIW